MTNGDLILIYAVNMFKNTKKAQNEQIKCLEKLKEREIISEEDYQKLLKII